MPGAPMETRESGMPAEDVWETFFSPEASLTASSTIRTLHECCGIRLRLRDVHDFGGPNRSRESLRPRHQSGHGSTYRRKSSGQPTI